MMSKQLYDTRQVKRYNGHLIEEQAGHKTFAAFLHACTCT